MEKILATPPKRRAINNMVHFNNLFSKFFHIFVRTEIKLMTEAAHAIIFVKLIAWLP